MKKLVQGVLTALAAVGILALAAPATPAFAQSSTTGESTITLRAQKPTDPGAGGSGSGGGGETGAQLYLTVPDTIELAVTPDGKIAATAEDMKIENKSIMGITLAKVTLTSDSSAGITLTDKSTASSNNDSVFLTLQFNGSNALSSAQSGPVSVSPNTVIQKDGSVSITVDSDNTKVSGISKDISTGVKIGKLSYEVTPGTANAD